MTNWSKYQQAVFDDVANGSGHTVITAVAGSGKTTTIVKAMEYVPTGCRTLFVAFNKSIAEELKKRAPRGVEVSTLHSYGLRTITKCLGRLRIDANRVEDLIKAALGDDPKEFDMRRDLAKTVSLAKGQLASDEADIDAIVDAFEIESAKNGERATFIQNALKILLQCTEVQEDGRIDFDDMIWLPVVLELRQSKFDRVFIDETQDLNRCQIELAMRAVSENGRICAVGDPRQAIYGFRGADSSAVSNVVSRLQAKVLPLSVCYRCCKSVIQEAQTVVPEIEWAPDAVDGVVSDATSKRMYREAKPGDFILSRTNGPLISICMALLTEGRRANIQGRDVGASLAAFVRKSKAKTVEALRDYVETWRNNECARLAQKRRDTTSVEDRAECILALSDGAKTVGEVTRRIESLFSDGDEKSRITLSTTHKAKGLERDRVWLLSDTYMKRPGLEEENLYYVACTRAKKELFLVAGKRTDP